jgi:outer membrane protein TolC
MKALNLLVLLLFSAQLSFAANLLDLQKTAVDNRAIVEKFKTNLAKSQEAETVAKSGYLPSFDLAYTMNRLNDDSLFENKENSVAYGALTWNLFRGFKDKYTIASVELQRSAEELKLAGIKQDIQLNVALKYLAIYSRKASLELQEDTYNTLLKAHEDALSRFQVGLIDKNELLKFKVDLDNAQISLRRAATDLVKSGKDLQREIDSKINIEELTFSEFVVLPQFDQKDVEKTMLARRSEIRVLEELAAAADLQVEASYADYYPRLDATTSYRQYADDFRSSEGSLTSEEVRGQLVMSVNVFDGFKKKSNVRRAKLDSQVVRHDLEELKLGLTTDLANLLLDYEVNVENTDAALGSIEQARENLRITELKYKEGLETEANLLAAIANLSRAKFNHILATNEVFKNYYQITRAVEGFADL